MLSRCIHVDWNRLLLFSFGAELVRIKRWQVVKHQSGSEGWSWCRGDSMKRVKYMCLLKVSPVCGGFSVDRKGNIPRGKREREKTCSSRMGRDRSVCLVCHAVSLRFRRWPMSELVPAYCIVQSFRFQHWKLFSIIDRWVAARSVNFYICIQMDMNSCMIHMM